MPWLPLAIRGQLKHEVKYSNRPQPAGLEEAWRTPMEAAGGWGVSAEVTGGTGYSRNPKYRPLIHYGGRKTNFTPGGVAATSTRCKPAVGQPQTARHLPGRTSVIFLQRLQNLKPLTREPYTDPVREPFYTITG